LFTASQSNPLAFKKIHNSLAMSKGFAPTFLEIESAKLLERSAFMLAGGVVSEKLPAISGVNLSFSSSLI
jgi:hypothetical protein